MRRKENSIEEKSVNPNAVYTKLLTPPRALRNDPDLTTRLRATPAIFSGKAEERGIQLSELLTEVLKRDIEINEALK